MSYAETPFYNPTGTFDTPANVDLALLTSALALRDDWKKKVSHVPNQEVAIWWYKLDQAWCFVICAKVVTYTPAAISTE